MSLKNDRYTYRVTWSEDDNEYAGFCAEFPSLSGLAISPEGALRGIRKIVADVVEDMQGAGEKGPAPIALLVKIIAANLWFVFLLKFTENLQCRQQRLVYV